MVQGASPAPASQPPSPHGAVLGSRCARGSSASSSREAVSQLPNKSLREQQQGSLELQREMI